MTTLAQDIRYGLRSFRKAPVFTGAVILSMALGIWANSTVFSVLNSLWNGTLRVQNPNALFVLSDGNSFSWPDYADYRAQTVPRVFDGLTAIFPLVPASVGGRGGLAA